MTLHELLQHARIRPQRSVPDWMLGCFRRRCISFANGRSDISTNVFWLQSRNFSIDLRLPAMVDQLPAQNPTDYDASQLQELASYEGWVADSVWDGEFLSWRGGDSLQLHNRWPEPAWLRRIGNCMMELAPSGAYVEDWRLQASSPGPLLGLRLINERELNSGKERPRGGGLIVCGDHAALVLGRAQPVEADGGTLAERVAAAGQQRETLARLFDFETSVAEGSPTSGYIVQQSTRPHRRGEPLLDLDGFEWTGPTTITHTLTSGETTLERMYSVDALEPAMEFQLFTPVPLESEAWLAREAATLTRYGECLF